MLLSEWAVMFGIDPAEPCAALLQADALPEQYGGSGEDLRALLPLGDLERAWLFRRHQEEPNAEPSVEYRTMSCHFDPQIEVPSEVLRAPGTAVLQRP